ncbi:hypothetical protein D9M69_657340 [compost metagenome]
MPVFDAFLAQGQVQPAPAAEHRAAIQAATEHGALVVDVGFQRQVQAQLLVMPVEHFEAHVPGEGNVVMENGFQLSTVAAHSGASRLKWMIGR